MEVGYTGWIVEWGDLGNRKRGIVVQETDHGTIVIFDENGADTVEVSLETRLVKIKPADVSDVKVQKNIRRGLQKWKQEDPDTHDIFIAILDGLEKRGLNSVKVLVKSTSRNKLHSSPKKKSPATSEDISNTNKVQGNDESDEDEDDSEDGEESGSEEEDDEDEEEEEESWDDESEEESSEEEDDDDDESSSDEEEDSSDEEERLDLKVYITLPGALRVGGGKALEVRGFSLVRSRALSRIVTTLTRDYSLTPRIFYRDSEGDDVLLRRRSDFKYAVKAHEHSQHADGPMKLYARFDEDSIGGGGDSVSVIRDTSGGTSVEVDSLDMKTSRGGGAQVWGAVISPECGQNSTPTDDSPGRPVGAVEPTPYIAAGGEFLWQKGELVGSGSFGEVFGGIHLESGRRIAVKEVHLSAAKGHLDQARALQTEIKVLSALEHPNIIKYHGGT